MKTLVFSPSRFYLLLAFLLFTISIVKAQIEWCKPGAIWYNHYCTMAGCLGFVETQYTKDTVYAGMNCKKLIQLTRCRNITGGPVWDSYADRYTYEENGIIFFYGLTGNHWDTLFNFNTPVSGSWRLSTNDSANIKVHAKGYKVISGDTLEWLATNYIYPDTNSVAMDTIYERIGITGPHYAFIHPIFNNGNWEPSVSGLCSYRDSIFSLYGLPDSVCTYITPVSVSTLDMNQFEVSPNPFSDKLVLTSRRNDEQTLTVTDAFGRKIRDEEFKSNMELNTKSWSAGMYYFFITNKTGGRLSYKLVKE